MFQFRTIFFFMVFAAFAANAGAVGLSIQIDPDKPLTVSMARKFIASTEGGIFSGPDELANITADIPTHYDLTGFTGQDILDCPEPCGMFYLPGFIGNRIQPTIRNLISDSRGWFWGESFINTPLTRGWLLVSFRTSGTPYGFHGRRPDAVSAVWILQNSPPFFKGRFYTSDRARDGGKVIVGRDRAGGILIDKGARDNFVIDEGVVDLAFVSFRPLPASRTSDPYYNRQIAPSQGRESRKEKLWREMEESSRKKK